MAGLGDRQDHQPQVTGAPAAGTAWVFAAYSSPVGGTGAVQALAVSGRGCRSCRTGSCSATGPSGAELRGRN